jgi:predicted SAM-dependent methyltransferase
MSLCLNIGCHDIHLNGFINIDLNPAMKPDRVLDVFDLDKHYAEGTVDAIYLGHFLEHFPWERSLNVLNIVHYVLKDFGVLFVVVPDVEKAVNMKLPINQVERIGLGAVGAENDQHLCFYSETRLRDALKIVGFGTIIITDVKNLTLCRFPNEAWQTAAVAIKHSTKDIFQDWQKK